MEKDNSLILRELFGDNRAEWSPEQFRELFVLPTYFKKLESHRPCFLVGGRGTGKTTSLQSLRFDSTLERLEAEGLDFGDQDYLGVLVRMNKNRVRAFQGGDVQDQKWDRLFAHYVNLLICLELSELSLWLENKTGILLSENAVEEICDDLGMPICTSINILKKEIKRAISRLQIYVNNPFSDDEPILSMAEAPVKTFSEVLRDSGLTGERVIFCCIDEYENILNSQQAIINTYIKHAEPPLSYKIGVRKNGLRNHQTIDNNDLLSHPDDFYQIEVAEEGFDYFARAVANQRLQRAKAKGINVPENVNDFLEELSFREESKLLGSEKIAKTVIDYLKEKNGSVADYFDSLPAEEVSFLKYWSESDEADLFSLASDWIENPKKWNVRLGNHGYSSLFWLSKGRKGLRIRKYYCGARVLLSLAAGNIRYFLELLDTAIGQEIDEKGDLPAGLLTLSVASQTKAARIVGQRRLGQLEGLADNGVELKRLVLAIGKIFFEFARSPAGRTPEVTSFILSGETSEKEQIRKYLVEGVGHLAFEVTPRTKATSNLEMKDDEYRLHPIFCAFFEISHRRKRSTTFDAGHLLKVLERPKDAISLMLGENDESNAEELPEQLAFFSAFFEGGE